MGNVHKIIKVTLGHRACPFVPLELTFVYKCISTFLSIVNMSFFLHWLYN